MVTFVNNASCAFLPIIWGPQLTCNPGPAPAPFTAEGIGNRHIGNLLLCVCGGVSLSQEVEKLRFWLGRVT